MAVNGSKVIIEQTRIKHTHKLTYIIYNKHTNTFYLIRTLGLTLRPRFARWIHESEATGGHLCVIRGLESSFSLELTNTCFFAAISVAGSVPGGVYSDLHSAGVIGHILIGFNDVLTRWVAYDFWTYTARFTGTYLRLPKILMLFLLQTQEQNFWDLFLVFCFSVKGGPHLWSGPSSVRRCGYSCLLRIEWKPYRNYKQHVREIHVWCQITPQGQITRRCLWLLTLNIK